MNKDVSTSFESHFGILSDPRIDRSKLYPLTEILFIVLSGSICGAESWRDFVLFGKEKLDFMRQYYPFENGAPSKNTFARVLAALDTEAFKLRFVEWVKSLQVILNDVIAMDGKTLCNSIDEACGTSAIHMVRAHWLIENGLHWTLDVVFNEDNSLVRKDNAGENMAIIRHITLNMLNNAKKSFKNVGLKALRKKAGWGNETLAFILNHSF